jgi:hypothetical protein
MSTHASPRRTLSLSLAALATTALLLTGCSGAGDDPSPTTTSSSPTSPSPSSDPSGSATSASPSPTAEPSSSATTPAASPGTGCPAAGDGVPQGASSTEVVDVDGDGRPDTAWLTAGADRAFGITTASGATFSAPITSASPIPASAVVGSVATTDAGDVPIALVDLGREAQLFALTDCTVTQTTDPSGQPYVFDRGFGDQGTGVGCSDVDGAARLAGLLATQEGDGWTVTRTLIDLSEGGRVAANGTVAVVAEEAAADDAVVTTAQEVSCGDLVAGAGGLTEAGGA